MVTGVPIPTPFDLALQKTVAQAQADLARRLHIEGNDMTLVDVQSVTWPDGGLGCPQPGMEYTQVQVDGLLIRFTCCRDACTSITAAALSSLPVRIGGRSHLDEGTTADQRTWSAVAFLLHGGRPPGDCTYFVTSPEKAATLVPCDKLLVNSA